MTRIHQEHFKWPGKIIIVFVILACSNAGFGAIDTPEDRVIAYTLLDEFGRQCTHVSSIDGSRIRQVKSNVIIASQSGDGSAERCMREELSQAQGVFQIYSKLCDDVTQGFSESNEKDLPQMVVNSQRYKNGVRPFIQRMNDCLRVAKNGDKYIVKVSGVRVENVFIVERLDKMKRKPVFKSNRVDFR